ncbi:VACUOLAR IMPORT AND DEGRADATION PROTEIN 27 [Salix viminalis]|uniref:VACUOLAR IMPORT AND DEGRADATION PROTEIN 27 n=1 Tax=Salix viminalis TaxID=40686 RepID=A0A9Q0SFF3_SALVM|nr:VACUOLAR IMPORT AND DEGRADATION PROTEIN 27 [Salix viminalis]
MGGSQSREDLELSDSDTESQHEEEEEESYQDVSNETPEKSSSSGRSRPQTPSSFDEVESKLKALKLKYPSTTTQTQQSPNPNFKNGVKLYLHIGDEEEDEEESESEEAAWWVLRVSTKIRAKVAVEMQLKTLKEQRRVDFVAEGQTKVKVYGKDFVGWANPEKADDSMWEDAEDDFMKSPGSATHANGNQDLREEFEEASNGGIQSLALGALDNSFLVGDSGIQVVKNLSHGIQGKGVYVNFGSGNHRSGSNLVHSTPKKALLMRAETNMLLMRSTFLGLDDNRLCRWDMRDRHGIVQDLATANTPVLNWTQGHQFSRGTNFQCFASTGDGSIVVGSLDGKIRLYSTNSMRQAKTAFPGLGSPITHVDVTFDGKWILGTTDTYLILICSLFTDKDGKTKTGFNGRMGNRIAAPRLLKLTPLDSHLAGVNNKFRKAQFSWRVLRRRKMVLLAGVSDSFLTGWEPLLGSNTWSYHVCFSVVYFLDLRGVQECVALPTVTENGKQERHLVATVGKFSVIWNFQQVKNGSHECYRNQEGLKSCYCYKIVLKDDSIVDSRFMHDKFAVNDSPEAPLVIATPMKVSSFSISSRR